MKNFNQNNDLFDQVQVKSTYNISGLVKILFNEIAKNFYNFIEDLFFKGDVTSIYKVQKEDSRPTDINVLNVNIKNPKHVTSQNQDLRI